jgi:hypothetical protein
MAKERVGCAGANAECRASRTGRIKICCIGNGANADNGFRHLSSNGANTIERDWCAERHFEDANTAGDNGMR